MSAIHIQKSKRGRRERRNKTHPKTLTHAEEHQKVQTYMTNKKKAVQLRNKLKVPFDSVSTFNHRLVHSHPILILPFYHYIWELSQEFTVFNQKVP